MFRSLIARESITVLWLDVLREIRRLDAPGEIRGGWSVTGFTGERYALPETVETLLWVRRAPTVGAIVTLSAADTLNLAGIVRLGDRVPVTPSSRIAILGQGADRDADGYQEDRPDRVADAGPGVGCTKCPFAQANSPMYARLGLAG